MSRAVPSQVRELILKLFPDLASEPDEPGAIGLRQATAVRAVVDILARIPEEFIRLSADDFALYCANTSALVCAYDDRQKSNNQLGVGRLPNAGHSTLYEIHRLLAKCPDETAAVHTTGLEFLPNDRFREGLRTDISSANSALINHEYKAAAVLGGSVVEALLLWGLEKEGEPGVRTKVQGAQSSAINEWTLGQMIAGAHACKLISDNTRKQAELAQNFRNLIHPGRQARLQETCDRGAALGTLAAVEKVAADLAKKFPRPYT
jgi:hypothetical protein